jgi:murein DD-endopeptidase MepM/ murein hydrolase activator NlpD
MRRRLQPQICFAAWSALGVGIHGLARRGGQWVTDLVRGGSLGFRDKRSFRSRARSGFGLVARHRRSIVIGGTAAIGLASSTYLAALYLRYERLATADTAAIARTEIANADLQEALGRLRDQLGTVNQALNTAQSRVATLSEEAQRQLASSEQVSASKADRVAQLSHSLEQAQRELHLAEAQRVTLMARLSKAEAELAEGLARQQQAQSGLDQWQKKIQQLTSERDKAAIERDQLRARVSELEKHSLSRMQPPAQPLAAAQPRPAAPAAPETVAAAVPAAPTPPAAAPVAPAQAVAPMPAPPVTAEAAAAAPAVAAVAPAAPAVAAAAAPQQVAVVQPGHPAPTVAVRSGGLAQFERVLASAGVDVTHLFAQYGMRTGEGGPFIPAPRGTPPETSLTPEKLAALQSLMRTLPVSAPLASYELGSGFGMRGDPVNGRAALHTGIDLLAPYMSPVYATAPGVVTFSGYRDDYGKVVEIDHGHGIATRYAHLHRATVSVGQRVAAQTQIGFLGSTGRATGPHVHYEVVVNGEPQDPVKFLGLARLVPVAQR